MIRSTFRLAPGFGAHVEKTLWNAGRSTWDDLPPPPKIKLPDSQLVPSGSGSPLPAMRVTGRAADVLLLTGADGSASIELTVPDSVTSWNVWLHAVTKDLRGASLKRETKSVKELMVRPYVPRFLREGDRAELKVVVNNASEGELKGILGSKAKRMALLKEEMDEVARKYGDERRTEIVADQGEFSVEDLIAGMNPNMLLYLGDVYEKGTYTEFYNWYGDGTNRWSRFKADDRDRYVVTAVRFRLRWQQRPQGLRPCRQRR